MNRTTKIGLEFEMTGIYKSETVELLRKYMKASCYDEFLRNNIVCSYGVEDAENRSWKIVHDSSIEPKRTLRSKEAADAYRVELITPLITWDDLDTVNGLLYDFADHGASTTKTCGLHIHADISDFDAADIRRLCNNFYYNEPKLLKILNVNNERAKYCLPMREEFIKRIGNIRCPTMKDLRSAWYEVHRDEKDLFGETRYHLSRYHGLNLHSLWRGTGVEFRLFNSTLEGNLVKSYVTLVLCMIDAVKEKRACRRSNRNEFPDNKAIRRWLNQLGISSTENAVAWNNLTSALD